MVNSFSIAEQGPAQRSLALPNLFSNLGFAEEHFAPLVDFRNSGLLRRWDDLLDEGVAAIFSITDGEAELVGLCFHARRFTPAESATWLGERGFKPLLFIPS
jgi:hypothetical protein